MTLIAREAEKGEAVNKTDKVHVSRMLRSVAVDVLLPVRLQAVPVYLYLSVKAMHLPLHSVFCILLLIRDTEEPQGKGLSCRLRLLCSDSSYIVLVVFMILIA